MQCDLILASTAWPDFRDTFAYSHSCTQRVHVTLMTRRTIKFAVCESQKSGKDAGLPTPSPHHRTCGSAYGGSTKMSTFCPESL